MVARIVWDDEAWFKSSISDHNMIQRKIKTKEVNMNALQLLENDHRTVETLFDQVENTENFYTRKQIFQQIKGALERHADLEEAVFYPRLIQEPELKEEVIHAIEEHHQVKLTLKEMSNPRIEEGEFNEMLYQLIEDVNHHVEEEESEMFPQVEEILGEKELLALGGKMMKFTLDQLK